MKFTNLEFVLLPKGDISYSVEGGTKIYTETDYNFTDAALDYFSNRFPKEVKLLEKEYSKSKFNIKFHQYQVVNQFIACAFGPNNNIKDIDENGCYNLEPAICPRAKFCTWGICKIKPKGLTDLEAQIVELLATGISTVKVAATLGKEYNTVREAIGRACKRFGLTKNGSMLLAYCHTNKII